MAKPLLRNPAPGLAARVLREAAHWLGITAPYEVHAGLVDVTAATMNEVSKFFPSAKFELEGTWRVGNNSRLLAEMAPLESVIGQFVVGPSNLSLSASRRAISLRAWKGPSPFSSLPRLLGQEVPLDIYWHDLAPGVSAHLGSLENLQIRITPEAQGRDEILGEILAQVGPVEVLTYCRVCGRHEALVSLESSGCFDIDRLGLARGLTGVVAGPTTENLDVLVNVLDVLESDPRMTGYMKLATRVAGIAEKPMEVFLQWIREKKSPADIKLDSLDRLPAAWKSACIAQIRAIEQRFLEESVQRPDRRGAGTE